MAAQPRLIKTLLVANRGEIACRIFRTARRLGLRTVAVFSDADANARHVREADAALHIGATPARESYLNAERILTAARAAHAAAIHPGYGFLSENAAFAEACAAAGLIFVGPPAASIIAMGSKILAKTRMQAAGVPVLPGYAGEQQDLAHLRREALRAGLPLIIKPAAGGGGKGMQIVRKEAELTDALRAARRLAESAFGDGALLIERYLPHPRHVEVQVFADADGHLLHLGERDCSTQRRHQKLIEEAPAPQLPEPLRVRLREAALVVAREIGYVGAGTVEFLYDGEQFFFMEMNTRLQVEHTVTEAITGIDLVEWQLRIASGEALPLTQEQVRFSGHAIEARVCAEDPRRGFLPSAGRLALLEWPQQPQVRVDAGFDSGDSVPDAYDSLLGKVISWAPSRAEAAARLARALEHTYCAGVHTNDHWLAQVLRSERFLSMQHNVALLDEGESEWQESTDIPPEAWMLAALSVTAQPAAAEAHDPWAIADAFTPNLPGALTWRLSCQEQNEVVRIEYAAGVPVSVGLAHGAPLTVAQLRAEGGQLSVQLAERRLSARHLRDGARIWLWLGARAYEFLLDDPRTHEFSASAASGGLTTPLPGTVVSVPVQVGTVVEAGVVLMVIEAMKMEHAITAPYAGTVAAIHFAEGARVPEGSALLELTRAPAPATRP